MDCKPGGGGVVKYIPVHVRIRDILKGARRNRNRELEKTDTYGLATRFSLLLPNFEGQPIVIHSHPTTLHKCLSAYYEGPRTPGLGGSMIHHNLEIPAVANLILKACETSGGRSSAGDVDRLGKRSSNSYGPHRQTNVAHEMQHSKSEFHYLSSSPLSPKLIASVVGGDGGLEQPDISFKNPSLGTVDSVIACMAQEPSRI